MNAKLSPLELLKKFLKEQPKEKIDKIISGLEERKYEGGTVDEYFSTFNDAYHDYHKDMFCTVDEADYAKLWDSLLVNLSSDKDPIERIEIIDVVSKEQQDFTKNMPNWCAFAA
jgi:hypothetical protein